MFEILGWPTHPIWNGLIYLLEVQFSSYVDFHSCDHQVSGKNLVSQFLKLRKLPKKKKSALRAPPPEISHTYKGKFDLPKHELLVPGGLFEKERH